MSSKWIRALGFVAFLLVSLAGSIYYWLNGSLHLRSERRVMWTGAVQWWEGMRGRVLTQHREGIQVAELDPASGRVASVRDLYVDPAAIPPALKGLAPGRWLVVTGLQTGSPELIQQLDQALQAYGWKGTFDSINTGAGILVLAPCGTGTHLCEVAADLSDGATAALTLPAGTQGPDGRTLRSNFAIRVQPYD